MRKKVYTDKDRMEHLTSSLQVKNKITVKVLLLKEENLKLRNQIIENNENMSNEPLSKKTLFAVDQSKNRWLNFKNKKNRKIFAIQGYSAKTQGKVESSPSPICINETDMNDNKILDNNEDLAKGH